MYLVLEGIDGCGKDTQLDLLSSFLRKRKITFVRTAEPTTFLPTGLFIKGVLRGCYDLSPKAMTLLFLADTIEHQRKKVFPALKEGKWVISSRSFVSTLAYQMAAGVEKEFILDLINRLALLWPDKVIILDVLPETALSRKREKTHRYEKLEFLEKVKENYLFLAKEFGFYIVNGEQPPEDVFEEIKQLLDLN